jgi:broad specificity phosphatase PhoE
MITSQEQKAAETGELVARQLGLPLTRAANLGEHRRGNEPWQDDRATFEARIRRFFDRPAELVFGEETADQAHQRFATAVSGLVAAARGRSIALVTHGTVMTLFLARQCGLEPFGLWRSLAMPAVAVLTTPGYHLERLVADVAAPVLEEGG